MFPCAYSMETVWEFTSRLQDTSGFFILKMLECWCEAKGLITSYRTKAEMEQESMVDGNLSTEASLIVLDTLEIVVKVNDAFQLWRLFRMHSLFLCLHLFSDCGGIRAEGKCSGWSAESPPPQHGRKPERPLPAALLHYTKSSSFQGT